MSLFERVEHNPILALSGGKQVVLLAVGPSVCELEVLVGRAS